MPLYVTVSGRDPSQDRVVRRRWMANDEIAGRLDAPPSRVEVVQTLLRATPHRSRRSAPGMTAPGFSPRSSSPSKRWPANCPPAQACRCRVGHTPELARAAVDQGLVASFPDTTNWRWLYADAIRPCQGRSWISPRFPNFEVMPAEYSTRTRAAGTARNGGPRLRHLRRRKDLYPSAGAHP